MNSDITPPPIPTPATAVLADTQPTPIPMGAEADSLDTAWTATPTVLSSGNKDTGRFVPESDMRTTKWWKRNIRRSLIVILILLLLGGTVWGLKALLEDEPEVILPVSEAPAGLDGPFYGGAQNPGTLTIRRELVVTNNATFERSVTVKDGLDVGGNLAVAGAGIYGGPVTAAGFYGDGSNLTGINVKSCSDCVALQGTPTAPQTGNIHISGSITADNFNGGRFYGDGSGLTNLPGLKGNFVSLQDESPGTQQAGHLNISGTGLFGSRVGIALTAPGFPLDVAGAINSSLELKVAGITVCTVDGCTVAGGGGAAGYVQGGNSFGATALLGTNDSFDLAFETNNTERLRISATGDVAIAGNTAIGGTLDVTGATGLSTLSTSGAANLNSLTVVSTSDLQGNTNVGGSLNVSGTTTLADLSAAASTLASLAVTGNTAIGGTLDVTGASTLASLAVTNNATVGGTLSVTGTVTGGTYNGQTISSSASFTGTLTAASIIQGSSFISTVATGTAPLSVASTTKVTNLNSDLLDGLDSTAFAAASGSASYIQNGTTLQSSANFNIQSAAAGSVGGIIRGATSQTADLQQWQNSAGARMLGITSDYRIVGRDESANTGYIRFRPSPTSTPEAHFRVNGTLTALGLSGIEIGGNSASNALSFGGAQHVGLNWSAVAGTAGGFGVGTLAGAASGTFSVGSNQFNFTVSRFRGAAGQTADLTQWQNSTGTVIARVDASGNGFFNNGGGGTGAAFVQGGNSFGTIASLGTNDAFDLQLETGGTPKLTVQAGGNVGVGTTGPLQKLHVEAGGIRLGTTSNANNVLDTLAQAGAPSGNLFWGSRTLCDNTQNCSGSGTGYIQNGTTLQSSANFAIQSATATDIGGVIRGATSQTADLLQLQNSSGTVLAKTDNLGNQYAAGLYVNRRFDQGSPSGGIYFINSTGSAYVRPIIYNHNANSLTLGNGVTAVNVNSTTTFNVVAGIGASGFKATVGAGATFTVNDHSGGPAAVLQGSGSNQTGLVLKGVAGQTADLLQAQDSTGAILAKIDAGGNLTVKNATVQGTLTVTGNVTFSGNVISYSNNVRGINQAITLGSNTLAVTFGTAYPDAAYAVTCTPNYDTTCFVTNKTTAGFTLNFGTAAPASATADWFVVH